MDFSNREHIALSHVTVPLWDRLYRALRALGVTPEEFAFVANDRNALRIVAAFIVSTLHPSHVTREGAPLVELDPTWSQHQPDTTTLFPRMSCNTPRLFTQGLLCAGVQGRELRSLLTDPSAIATVASMVRISAETPFVLNQNPEQTPDQSARPVHQGEPKTSTKRYPRGIPCEVEGLNFEQCSKLLEGFKSKGIVGDVAASVLLGVETCWLRRGKFLFRAVPSASFLHAPYASIVRALRRTYDGLNPDRVEVPLVLAFAKLIERSEVLARFHWTVEWVRVIQRPFSDMLGNRRVITCHIDQKRRLRSITLDDAPDGGDRFDGEGAFAALVA